MTVENPENRRAMVMKALGAATVSAVVTSLVVTAIRDPSELSTGLIVFFLLYGIPIAGVAALTVGLPAHLLLSRFRVRSLMAYLIAGVIAAVVFGVWLERLPVTPHPVSWREVLRMTAFALPGGLLAAAMFWRIAVRPSLTSRLPIDK
jgi:uncharacterized membrane protein YvlD (DUF360 family)